jgi:hypothetical protein
MDRKVSAPVLYLRARRRTQGLATVTLQNDLSAYDVYVEIYYVECTDCGGRIDVDRKPEGDVVATAFASNWARTLECSCGKRANYAKEDLRLRTE